MKFFFIPFCLLFLSNTGAAVEKIALIVGNNIGLPGDEPLQYASIDAKRIQDVLIELGEVKKEMIFLFTNKKSQDVFQGFKRVQALVEDMKSNQKNVSVFIYYSGHADPNGLHIEGDEVPLKQILDFFEGLRADVRILMVDACYSGNLLNKKGVTLGPPVRISMQDEIRVKGTAIITSSTMDEVAYESRELKGSLFTHYWLAALRGAGDYNKDNNVTLMEAYTYAQFHTLGQMRHMEGPGQHPAFKLDLQGKEDLVLSRLNCAKAVILFNRCRPGDYEIISQSTHDVVARVSPVAEETLKVALPADKYIIQSKNSRSLFLQSVELLWGGQFIFNHEQMKAYPLEAAVRKGPGLWNFKPFVAMLRLNASRAVSVRSHILLQPEIALSYSFNTFAIGGKVSYGRDHLNGTYLTLTCDDIRLAGFVNVPFWRYRFWSATAGPVAGIEWMRQFPVRKDEATIRAVGYPKMPVVDAILFHAGVQSGISLLFHRGFLANLEIGVVSNIFQEFSKMNWNIDAPISIGLGKRF